MNRVERAQIDPRGVAAVVAVLIFLVITVAFTMIDSGVRLLMGLVGASEFGALVYGVALLLAFVLAVIGYLVSRLAVLVL